VLIDWFTVVAQIINFVVLMALLSRFLYKPIIRAMDARQSHIASQLAEAGRARTEAEQERASYRARNRDWDTNRQAMLAEVKAEAEAQRQELVGKARNEVEALQGRWHEAVQRQQTAFIRDLRQRAAKQLYAIARRVLQDLANTALDQRLAEVFLERLQTLSDERWRALAVSIEDGRCAVAIRSAFDLPETMRQACVQVLQDRLPTGVDVEFITQPDLICGMELTARGYKVSWSFEEYLETLEEEVTKALEGEAAEEGTDGAIESTPAQR
jgi:F-type H+-transporting ATPase subunit b